MIASSTAANEDKFHGAPRGPYSNPARAWTVRHRKILSLVLLALLFALYVFHSSVVAFFVQQKNQVATQSVLFRKLAVALDSRAAASHARAEKYFEDNVAAFEQAAASFELHPYFAEIASLITADGIGWNDLITLRNRAWVNKLRRAGRDDFRVEKARLSVPWSCAHDRARSCLLR